MAQFCGVDLYHGDNVSSFHDAYNAGATLFIIKTSQGSHYIDPRGSEYEQRIQQTDGALGGYYHFGDASDVNAQVRLFLSIARHFPLLALDWEPNNGSGGTMSLSQAEQFVSAVHQVRGKWPMVYTGSIAKETTIPASSPLRSCELWLAQYNTTPVCPSAWSKWRLWQFAEDYQIAGVDNPCDANKFPGTTDDLRRWYSTL